MGSVLFLLVRLVLFFHSIYSLLCFMSLFIYLLICYLHKYFTYSFSFLQGDIFSDLENTNVSLQPQLPSTPPPTTLSEYPPSPSYSYQAQSAAEDPLMIVPDMTSVTEGFTQLPQASPLHRNLSSTLNYDGSYHSPQYQTSPSHFASLSPSHATLSYANGHHQEESPLNFAGYMKYD